MATLKDCLPDEEYLRIKQFQDANYQEFGARTEEEKYSRIQATTLLMFNYLSNKGLLYDRTIAGDSFNDALEHAKVEIQRVIKNTADNPRLTWPQKEAKMTRLFTYLESMDKMKPLYRMALDNFFVKTTEHSDHMDLEQEMSESEETNPEHIYSLDRDRIHPLDATSASMKMNLATMTNIVFREGEARPDTDMDTGFPKPIDFDRIYSVILRNLTGLPTLHSMIQKLESVATEFAVGNSELYVIRNIVDKLKNGNDSNYNNQFYKAFKKTRSAFMNVVIDPKASKDNVKVYSANSKSLNLRIRNRWESNSVRRAEIPMETRTAEYNQQFMPFYTTQKITNPVLKTQVAAAKANVLRLDNVAELRDLVINPLNKIGIDMSLEALIALRNQLSTGRSGTATFNDVLFAGHKGFNGMSIAKLIRSYYVDGKNTVITEGNFINYLAKAQSETEVDISIESHLNEENNLIYPINSSTSATNLFEELGAQGERLQEFILDPYYGESRIIKEFANTAKAPRVVLSKLGGVTIGGKPLNYANMGDITHISTQLMLSKGINERGKVNNSMGWYFLPTPGDRKWVHIIKMPRFKNTQPLTNGVVSGDFSAWAVKAATAELNRIKQVRSEYDLAYDRIKKELESQGIFSDNQVKLQMRDELIDGYHIDADGNYGSGAEFHYFSELNKRLQNADTIAAMNPATPQFKADVMASLDGMFKNDLRGLAQINIIAPSSISANGEIMFDFNGKAKLSEEAKNIMQADTISINDIYSWMANSFAVNFDSQIFLGDRGLYKSNDNANKRAALPFTPGESINTEGNSAARPHYNVAIVNDVEIKSRYFEEYKRVLAKSANPYAKLAQTDGQGFMTIRRLEDILRGEGMLTSPVITALNELKKDNPNYSKVNTVFESLKGFNFGIRFSDKFGRLIPTNQKYSTTLLIPAEVNKSPMLKEMHDKMIAGNIDELVFRTAVKLGPYDVNNIDDPEFKSIRMDNRDWIVPQISPTKSNVDEKFGVQIRKLINVDNEQTRAQEIQDYHNAITANLNDDAIDFVTSLQLGDDPKNPDLERVVDFISRDINKAKKTFIPTFIEKAIKVVDGKPTIPLYFPGISPRVERSITAMVNREILKQRLPGYTGVQYSSLGFSKDQIGFDNELKFLKPEADKIAPAEIRVSPKYFIESLKKKGNTPAIKRLIEDFRAGNVKISSIDPRLLEVVTFRTPTQGKNFMFPARIVGFTSEAGGAKVMLPAEVVAQSSTDYDFDKMTLEFKHFEVDENTGKMSYIPHNAYASTELDAPREEREQARMARDNFIVQSHWDALTDLQNLEDILTPNHSNTLDAKAEQIEKIYQQGGEGNWGSPMTQLYYHRVNQAGRDMIGQMANLNTAHAFMQAVTPKLVASSSTPNYVLEESQPITPETVPLNVVGEDRIINGVVISANQNFANPFGYMDGYTAAQKFKKWLEYQSGVLPQGSQPINIWAGTNEHTSLSNMGKRPFQDYDSDIAGAFMKATNYDGIKWESVENAFQASKILHTKEGEYYTGSGIDKVLTDKGVQLVEKFAAADPYAARTMGSRKNLPGLNPSSWDAESSGIMHSLIKESFEQNNFEKQQLLATGNAPLTHTQDRSKWSKEFPRILMEVREELGGSAPINQGQPAAMPTTDFNPTNIPEDKRNQYMQEVMQFIPNLNVKVGGSTAFTEQMSEALDDANVETNTGAYTVFSGDTPMFIIDFKSGGLSTVDSYEKYLFTLPKEEYTRVSKQISKLSTFAGLSKFIENQYKQGTGVAQNPQAPLNPALEQADTARFYQGKVKPAKDTIFVFGSNPVGINGILAGETVKGRTYKYDVGGAAADARKMFGVAKREIMDNRLSKSGKAYGLVTVKYPGDKKSLTKNQIKANIVKMYNSAANNPTKSYMVAGGPMDKVGLNGYTGMEMAQMFNEAANEIPGNVIFPAAWAPIISKVPNDNINYGDIEPERRKWILEQIAEGKLKGMPIDNSESHASVLNDMINQGDSTLGINLPVGDTVQSVKELGAIKTVNGKEKISENINQLMTSALDNTNLGKLNINSYTVNVVYSLIEMGADLDYITNYLNSPLIRRATSRAMALFSSSISEKSAMGKAIRELRDEYKVPEDTKATLPTPQQLESTLNEAKTNQRSGLYAAEILASYGLLYEIGQEINRTNIGYKVDTNGSEQTYGANRLRIRSLSKIPGTYANKAYPPKAPLEYIYPDGDKYNRTSYSTFEINTVHLANNILDRIYGFQNNFMNMAMDRFTETISSDPVDAARFEADLYTQILVGRDGHFNMKSAFAENITTDYLVDNILLGENSLSERVRKQQEIEKRLKEQNASYQPNVFIMNLDAVKTDPESGFDLVNFNNRVSNSMSPEFKTQMMDGFYKLYKSDNKFMREIAQDLIVYAMSLEGFNRGGNSFQEFIHPSVYNDYLFGGTQPKNSMTEFFTGMIESFQRGEGEFNLPAMELKYLEQRGYWVKLPDLTYKKDIKNKIKNRLKAQKDIKYFQQTTADGRKFLGVRNDSNPDGYETLFELKKRPFVNYTYGSKDIMSYQTPLDIQQKAKANNQVVENNCGPSTKLPAPPKLSWIQNP